MRLTPAARAIVAATGEDVPSEALVLRERPLASWAGTQRIGQSP